MTEEMKKNYDLVAATLKEARVYQHACNVIGFDQETICPPEAMEEEGELTAFFGTKAFELTKKQEFIDAVEFLYAHLAELENDFEKVLVDTLHKDYVKTKNITPEMQHEFALIYNKSYVNWLNAKQKDDFGIFAPSLKEVRDVCVKQIELRDERLENAYDNLLDDYETGMTSEILDKSFNECKERLVPLLKKIMASSKKIRTDFMSRTVTDQQQKELSEYLLKVMGFDFNRGAFTTTEHPFTNGLAKNDIRVTTHYYPQMFASSMYSIIHEGGHALFEMFQPKENYQYFIEGNKTMGMHESVSRFYENRIGRSKEFIHLVYPKIKEIMPQVLEGVSEQELYEAINLVQPSLIRTEADEFTYTFHIIIRYEIEKEIMAGKVSIEDLPELWNKKYQEYLGVVPPCAKDGILQDVHWSSGFGYFPTYAIGNMYNSMYYNTMSKEFDLNAAVAAGDFKTINGWMQEHVWAKGDRQEPRVWIKEITGRDFTTKDFLDYLEEKYSQIYGL